MKRIIGIFAVLLVIAGFLAGCRQTEQEKVPQPPAVMVNDTLFYDSGQKVTFAKCGVMDGWITSTVEEWELPSKNGQSNFGKGYSWQLVDSHHIDIPMDDENGWHRFCDKQCDSYHSQDLCGYPLKEDMEDITVAGSKPFETGNEYAYPIKAE